MSIGRHAALLAIVLTMSALWGWCCIDPASPLSAQRARPSAMLLRTHAASAIYGPEHIRLRMNHRHPAHRELACTRCHSNAETSTEARESLIPREATCAPCHNTQLSRATTPQQCGACHQTAPTGQVRLSDFGSHEIQFSHAAHRDTACTQCHAVSESSLATRAHLPTMSSCFSCHSNPDVHTRPAHSATSPHDAGRPPRIPLRCNQCHLHDAGGQLQTQTAHGMMNPPRSTGMHHDHEWLTRHRWVAGDDSARCATCHRESECADCHDGRVRPMAVHPVDFIAAHGAAAQNDSPRCTSCHTTQSFCTECHARIGVSPLASPQALGAISQRFHPPAAVWSEGMQMHARQAERNLSSCISCHAENDCVQCHGSTLRGFGGSSPHPTNFRASCRGLAERNARACVQCHSDVPLCD